MAQPANSQPTNPLDQLRGIQAPQEATFWELAPGWWVVIAIIIIGVIYLINRWLKNRKRLELLKPAKQELMTIAQLTPNNHAIAELSALLKRLCLLYFPHKQVAALSGIRWVEFLNKQPAEPIFDTKATQIFSETLYKKDQQIGNADWLNLVNQSEAMIDFIIHNGGRA